MKNVLLVLSFLSLLSAGEIKVIVDDIIPDSGQVYIGVYNKDEKFTLPGKEVKVALVPATKTKITGTFKNLSLGESYAVFAYQDINSNGKLDKDKLGKPNEPVAFSNQTKKGFQNYLRSCFIMKGSETVDLMLHIK